MVRRACLLALIGAALIPAGSVASSDGAHAIAVSMPAEQVAHLQCAPDAAQPPEYAIGGIFAVNATGPKAGKINSLAGFAGARLKEAVVSVRIAGEGGDVALPLPAEIAPAWTIDPMTVNAAGDSTLRIMWASWGGRLDCAADLEGAPVEVPSSSATRAIYVHQREFEGTLGVEAGAMIAHSMERTESISGFAMSFFAHGSGNFELSGPEGQHAGGTATPDAPSFSVYSGPTNGDWSLRLEDTVDVSVVPRIFSIAMPL